MYVFASFKFARARLRALSYTDTLRTRVYKMYAHYYGAFAYS